MLEYYEMTIEDRGYNLSEDQVYNQWLEIREDLLDQIAKFPETSTELMASLREAIREAEIRRAVLWLGRCSFKLNDTPFPEYRSSVELTGLTFSTIR